MLSKNYIRAIINDNQQAVGEINCVDEDSLVEALHRVLNPHLYDKDAYLIISSGIYKGFVGKICNKEGDHVMILNGLEVRRCLESEVKPLNVLL